MFRIRIRVNGLALLRIVIPNSVRDSFFFLPTTCSRIMFRTAIYAIVVLELTVGGFLTGIRARSP